MNYKRVPRYKDFKDYENAHGCWSLPTQPKKRGVPCIECPGCDGHKINKETCEERRAMADMIPAIGETCKTCPRWLL